MTLFKQKNTPIQKIHVNKTVAKTFKETRQFWIPDNFCELNY